MRLKAGKLPPDLLRSFLDSIAIQDPAVVVKGQLGEDAAVIDTGGPELLVVKADPITLASEDAGRYLLAVNTNDLATTGAEPRWMLATVLLPQDSTTESANRILDSLRGACAEFGVGLVGGHTEITVGLDRPILAGFLLGTVPRGRLVRTSGARPGDAILLAGGIAIEGTAILAREHAAALRSKGVPEQVIERAAGWLRKPGISVLAAARAAHATGTVHAMHDPTEGGLITALHELAEAAGTGLLVDQDAIPVLPECREIASALELNPLGLLASGALLITLDPDEAPEAVRRLEAAGIPAARIGEVVGRERGRLLRAGGRQVPLPSFARDELARYLELR